MEKIVRKLVEIEWLFYLKYSFTVKEIPETLSLLTQNNRIKGIFVNGKEVRAAKTAYMKDVMDMPIDERTGAQPLLEQVFYLQ